MVVGGTTIIFEDCRNGCAGAWMFVNSPRATRAGEPVPGVGRQTDAGTAGKSTAPRKCQDVKGCCGRSDAGWAQVAAADRGEWGSEKLARTSQRILRPW